MSYVMSDKLYGLSDITYCDYFATTPIDPRVLASYTERLANDFANPASVDHDAGAAAALLVKNSRARIADLIGCAPAEITFTSGATESITLFLQGFAAAQTKLLKRKLKILASPVEHAAILENLRALVRRDAVELSLLNVDCLGRVDLHEIEHHCQGGIDLVCVMAVGNEIGNVYPYQHIAEIAVAHDTLYFCDATQAIGKIAFSLENLPNTVVVFSGHKFYAPKGIGALVAARDILLAPLFYGGGQERGLRPGTTNAPLVATLAQALDYAVAEQASDALRIGAFRDTLQARLQSHYPQMVVNGDTAHRVAGALHISLPSIDNKEFITRFRDRLALSTGAACSSGSERPSHVLRAMHLPDALIAGALRISLGRFTTESEVETAAVMLCSR